MTKKSGRTKQELPQFASVEEAAAFFDANSISEFIHESADEQLTGNEADQGILVPLRLDAETYAALQDKARQFHISPASLARRLLIERLCPPR